MATYRNIWHDEVGAISMGRVRWVAPDDTVDIPDDEVPEFEASFPSLYWTRIDTGAPAPAPEPAAPVE